MKVLYLLVLAGVLTTCGVTAAGNGLPAPTRPAVPGPDVSRLAGPGMCC